MENLKEARGTRGEWIWVFILRLTGLIMFLAPIYKPIVAYIGTDMESIPLGAGSAWFSLVGLFIAFGGKAVGVAINSLGAIFIAFLKRILNVK